MKNNDIRTGPKDKNIKVETVIELFVQLIVVILLAFFYIKILFY